MRIQKQSESQLRLNLHDFYASVAESHRIGYIEKIISILSQLF